MAGLIVGGEQHDQNLVHQLAVEHISKESCIILVTITCESMFAFNNPPDVNPYTIDVHSRF
jgi:hypothetical protein